MKKTKKNKTNSIPHPTSTKGQKLPYEKLRVLVYETIKQSRNPAWTPRQLIKKLKIGNGKSDLARVLDGLVKQGKLAVDAEGVYTSLEKSKSTASPQRPVKATGKPIYEGTIDMTRSGSAYVMTDQLEEDVYIPSRNMGGAMHKDKVQIELSTPRRGRKPEGIVVGILKRAVEQVIGTLKLYKNFAVVVPDRTNLQFDVIVPMDKLAQAVDGDKVVVKIMEWKDNSPTGEVFHVLGASGSHELEMQSILINNGFNLAWPDEVIEESRKLPEGIPEEEIAKRRDFRKITTFTIDPITAKDFDDALSIRTLENGNTEVGVHIADV